MFNNNVNIRHRVPALAAAAGQGEPRVAGQIEQHAPERPLVQAQENPNRAPGWINRMRQDLQQRANAVFNWENVAIAGVGTAAVGLGGGLVGYTAMLVDAIINPDRHRDETTLLIQLCAPMALVAGGIAMTAYAAQGFDQALADPALADPALANVREISESDRQDRNLADVVRIFRAERAGSSSADLSAFDWSQQRLFLNRAGEDVGHQVSRFLNRALASIQIMPIENHGYCYSDMNAYLDSLEHDPVQRKHLGEAVENLNAACLNRNFQGLNSILRIVRRQYDETMPFKDFMLIAMAEMALMEAEQTLNVYFVEKEKSDSPNVETRQALEGDVLKELRKKFPGLPRQLEGVHRFHGEVQLTEKERKQLTEEIIKKVTDPKECARFLQSQQQENAFMEKHFSKVLEDENVNAAISKENREKEYANCEELEDMMKVDMKLKAERDEKVQEVYAKNIGDFLAKMQGEGG